VAAAPFLVARAARAQNDVDPASSSTRQALRVLLGSGDAVLESSQSFSFNGRSYRGAYERTADGQIVNIVDLEEYLYSVVPREMPSGWPAEALAAQAICARTYVLQRSDPRRAYDLVPSELDQVYEGVAGETPATTAAVNASAGSVLSFGKGFAGVAYSSCCGGHTESSAEAWGNRIVPYLQGVVCTSCSDSPNYRWNRALALDAIAARLTSALAPFGRLQDVRITARDASGRARAFDLIADGGTATVSGSAFRRAIGPRVLPSLLLASVTPSPDRADLSIDGGGLGHGVGMCQWGARGMASQGRTAAQILAFYFPGTDLQNLTQRS
jgi:stage II sporulation protein D